MIFFSTRTSKNSRNLIGFTKIPRPAKSFLKAKARAMYNKVDYEPLLSEKCEPNEELETII